MMSDIFRKHYFESKPHFPPGYLFAVTLPSITDFQALFPVFSESDTYHLVQYTFCAFKPLATSC